MRRMGVLIALALGLALAPAAAKAEVVWLCKPGLAENPCEIPQDTTFQPGVVETPQPGPRAVDCFYVYPTVSNQLTANADKSRDPELVSIARYQAARYSLECRVFAPIYRQSTLASIATGYASASGADRELAYGDVLEAWREYLAKDNGGRGVVLIGHSQGTGMLRRLLREAIEPDPAQLRRIVGAHLIGGNVNVAAGKDVGGDFKTVPLCARPAQVACVVAFSTYAQDPSTNARFGRPPAEPAGREVACTDPRPLAGWKGPLRLLTPSESFAFGPIQAGIVVTAGGPPPSAETTWVSPPDRFEGGCRTINGANVLRIDPTEGSRRPNWFPEPNWGTHLVDVNLALEPLVSLAGRQAARWTNPQITLLARCARGRLRTGIGGRDASFVARHRIMRRGKRLRAVLHLRHGAPERLVLERARPRC